jgi:hypothetical protein
MISQNIKQSANFKPTGAMMGENPSAKHRLPDRY